jgi:hypothetical protein
MGLRSTRNESKKDNNRTQTNALGKTVGRMVGRMKEQPNIKIRIHQPNRMSEIGGTGFLQLVHSPVFRTEYNVTETESVFQTLCSARDTK